MTRFEEIGVEMQQNSRSREEADRRFKRSCDICCYTGRHLSCDRCAIDCAHSDKILILEISKPRHAGQSGGIYRPHV